MKLLLFSDLHCDATAARQIVDRSSEADVVIGAGDFATMRRGLSETLDVLKQIQRPTVVVAGNSETPDELTAACADWPAAHVLHGTQCDIDGVTFFGLGGAVPPTPFGPWSYDLSEDEASRLIRACPSGAVMVVHSPPRGVLDLSSAGIHLGSRTILDAIQRVRPPLLVCGHIHESGGQTAQLSGTTLINAGPRGMWFELNR
jgi:Icc-related predicted phosphoesterase